MKVDRGKPFPIQDGEDISWELAEKVYEGYAKEFPGSARQQSLERIAERGGWGVSEVNRYLGDASPFSETKDGARMKVGCNTPGCVTKEGMNLMENPGTNKQVFKCPRCGCEIIIYKESPQDQASLSIGNEDETVYTDEKGLFMQLIDDYNERQEFSDHYLQISKDKVMVIVWNQSWEYHVYELEQPPEKNCSTCEIDGDCSIQKQYRVTPIYNCAGHRPKLSKPEPSGQVMEYTCSTHPNLKHSESIAKIFNYKCKLCGGKLEKQPRGD